jgi:hypothetical protein
LTIQLVIAIASLFALPGLPREDLSLRGTPATLIEAHEFEPCDYNCGAFNNPRTAYCIEVDGAVIIGERKGVLWFGEDDKKSLRSMKGMKLLYAARGASFTLATPNGQTISVKHQTKYEGFTDRRCRIQVHEPKLTEAAANKRPKSVPNDAFAVAGSQIGDFKPDFVWYACAKSVQAGTIECNKWYPDGRSRGIEHYCLSSLSGIEVPPDFKLDYVASSEGNLILSSGDALRFDHRGRINDTLHDSNETCR